MMKSLPPCVLTVAGSDSGGGAGVQADARTIHALGGFACMAITAITAQNTRGVQRWRAEPAGMIAAQIAAVLGSPVGPRGGGERATYKATLLGSRSEATRRRIKEADRLAHARRYENTSGALGVRAIKTGLLPGAPAVRAVVEAIAGFPHIPLVVDPVIGSTSGTRFLNATGLRLLRRQLLPRATLVTPNWPEAEALVGSRVRTFVEAERAARAISAGGTCAVLLKGGHAPGNRCRDCLVTPDGAVQWFESVRIATPNSHGTGCVLSAAIATELAKGTPLVRAVVLARDFLQRALRDGRQLDWRGAGPAYFG